MHVHVSLLSASDVKNNSILLHERAISASLFAPRTLIACRKPLRATLFIFLEFSLVQWTYRAPKTITALSSSWHARVRAYVRATVRGIMTLPSVDAGYTQAHRLFNRCKYFDYAVWLD